MGNVPGGDGQALRCVAAALAVFECMWSRTPRAIRYMRGRKYGLRGDDIKALLFLLSLLRLSIIRACAPTQQTGHYDLHVPARVYHHEKPSVLCLLADMTQ